jgi:hypothetical protein
MTLATKNGSLIVKDGLLAENCGCCGEWWCYDGAAAGKCFCVCEDSQKTLPNILLFNCTASSWNPPAQLSGLPNPSTGGDIVLTRPAGCTSYTWSGSYVSESQTIVVRVVGRNVMSDASLYGEGLNLDWVAQYTVDGSTYQQAYSNTFLTSSGQFSAGAGKTALNDLCNGYTMTAYQAQVTFTATVRRGD